jgi:hypothetical protein
MLRTFPNSLEVEQTLWTESLFLGYCFYNLTVYLSAPGSQIGFGYMK